MKLRLTAPWQRLLLCGAVVMVPGCTSSVDHLGYGRAYPSPSHQGRVETVLGTMTCSPDYPSGYRDAGYAQIDIDKKIDSAFSRLFHGTEDNETIYFHVSTGQGQPGQAVIRDILHDNQVRTEGMGLGMLIAAMLEERDEFDRLWRYARQNLAYTSGPLTGHFRSYCDNTATDSGTDSETKSRECPDPYGLQQFVMALLLARQRWLPAEGTPDYGDEAARLFDVMRNSEGPNAADLMGGAAGASFVNGSGASPIASDGGTGNASSSTIAAAGNDGEFPLGVSGAASGGAGSTGITEAGSNNTTVSAETGGTQGAGGKSGTGVATALKHSFDDATRLVYDDPSFEDRTVTGTSLLMPGYYSVWAQVTGDPFYAQAADQSRAFFRRVANPETGLIPIRANFDATPVEGWGDFAAEAYRALLNLAIDRIWGTTAPWQDPQIRAMLDFFLSQGATYGSAYTLDGKTVIVTDHQPELVMVVAVIAAISNHPNKQAFIDEAWQLPVPSGRTRYYPGILYLVSNLILGGRFRLCP